MEYNVIFQEKSLIKTFILKKEDKDLYIYIIFYK